MKPLRLALLVAAATALGAGGAVVAGGWQNAPAQDATPAPDPVGDALRSAAGAESAPAGDPAPAIPIPITPPTPPVDLATAQIDDATPVEEKRIDEESEEDKIETEEEKAKRLDAGSPAPRPRRRVAIVEAIDKITAESMRFEVEVGGRPVRFKQSLIFTARACEVSGPEELVNDAIAYMDVTLQPRGAQGAEPRQIFRGWMYASTPALSGLQHPIYDAWIVGCKA